MPHRQVVLTIPKRLRIFFRFERRLLGELLACSWRAWRLYLEASLEASCQPGGVGFIQTAGELLGFHPHAHLLLTEGGFLPDGNVLAFLARVLDHVPEPRQQQLRYWGWYSNAARGKRSKAQFGLEPDQDASASAELDRPLPRRRAGARTRRVSWARLIKKVYEVDPLLCPYCGAEMSIVAFVVEVSALRRLSEALGVGPQEAEPLSRAPPGAGELVYESVEG